MENRNFEFLIITGMSGAGKSQAINFFEDRGYFCIDNLPASLLSSFLDLYYKSKGKIKKLAFVIDIRGWNLTENFFEELNILKAHSVNYQILFLDAKDEILLNRFKFTRRKHPLSTHSGLLDNIMEERRTLSEIRNIADLIIDTSELPIKDLREKLEFQFQEELSPKLKITFASFGFKYGIPIDLDLMFDVRFLPNPYYRTELRERTGNEKDVQDYVMNFEESLIFFEKLIDLLDFLFPKYVKEGKTHITVGMGCTGGRHRSVTFANKLYEYFKNKEGYEANISHRDVLK